MGTISVGKRLGTAELFQGAHRKKVMGGTNQAQEKQQAGIFLPVAEQLWNFHSTVHSRDGF